MQVMVKLVRLPGRMPSVIQCLCHCYQGTAGPDGPIAPFAAVQTVLSAVHLYSTRQPQTSTKHTAHQPARMRRRAWGACMPPRRRAADGRRGVGYRKRSPSARSAGRSASPEITMQHVLRAPILLCGTAREPPHIRITRPPQLHPSARPTTLARLPRAAGGPAPCRAARCRRRCACRGASEGGPASSCSDQSVPLV